MSEPYDTYLEYVARRNVLPPALIRLIKNSE